jgi:protein-S-isoprenylcysteine O-methyltransferase Ste14
MNIPLYNICMNLIKTLIFLLFVPGTVLVAVPRWIAHRTRSRKIDLGPVRYAAIVFWLTGAALMLSSFWQFITRGRGTPAPVDPPEELVVSGPYRYTRNPQYAGGILFMVGHLLWTGAVSLLPYMAAVTAAFHTFIILYEEPNLEQRFGGAFRWYKRKVPRWFF